MAANILIDGHELERTVRSCSVVAALEASQAVCSIKWNTENAPLSWLMIDSYDTHHGQHIILDVNCHITESNKRYACLSYVNCFVSEL